MPTILIDFFSDLMYYRIEGNKANVEEFPNDLKSRMAILRFSTGQTVSSFNGETEISHVLDERML